LDSTKVGVWGTKVCYCEMLVGGAAGVQVRDPVDTMREGQIHGRIRDK